MTVGEALKSYTMIEIELLLAHVLKKPKEFLYLNPRHKLTTKQLNTLKKLIKRRRKGEPIAYILGYKDFYGLRFKVTKDTLVPRPETELIVDTALKLTKNSKLKIKNCLDIGTGSGCIAISIAKNSKTQVSASDISKKALVVARQNSKTHKVKVQFIQSNLLTKIKFPPDLIIANLPYGWKAWKNNSSAATIGLKFEPKHALFSKEGGLFEIHRLLEQVANQNSKPRFILLEFDPRQKAVLAKLIKKTLPGGSVKFYKDLAGLWRVVEVGLT